MNPIIEALCAAVAAGLVSGAIWVRRWRPVVAETRRALPEDKAPVDELDATDRDLWDGEFSELGNHLAKVREQRAKAQADRADTLRGIYLASLEVADQEPGEVPSR